MSLLHFEIDGGEVEQIVLDLGATEKQVKLALHRALMRTATTLRVLGSRYLKNELGLRTIALLRRRMKSLKMKITDGDGFTLWFGLNDMPVSWFKGTPKETTTGAVSGGQEFAGGFVGKSTFKKRKTIFKRQGKARLHISEQLRAISDKGMVTIEDKIFVQAEEIFWKHFKRDLQARVNYKLGES